MIEYIFTFGASHPHYPGCVKIEASNEERAMDKMVEYYGFKWCSRYRNIGEVPMEFREVKNHLVADDCYYMTFQFGQENYPGYVKVFAENQHQAAEFMIYHFQHQWGFMFRMLSQVDYKNRILIAEIKPEACSRKGFIVWNKLD